MLTPRVTETVRAGRSGDVMRDVLLERQFTTEAARLVGIDPSGFIAYSEARTLRGPLRNAAARDWVEEARQEAGDWRNYLSWEAQRIIATGHADGLPHLAAALSHVLLAWRELDLYEQERHH